MITNVNGFNYNTAFVKPKPKTQVQFGNAGTGMAKSLTKTAKTNEAVSTVVERAKETAGSFLYPKSNSGRTELPMNNNDYGCTDRVMNYTLTIPEFPLQFRIPESTKTGVLTTLECKLFPSYTISPLPTSASPTSVPTSTSASSGASSNFASNIALVRCLMPRSILNSLKKFFTGN